MPLYRFFLHGRGPPTADETRGFYVTRHAYGASEAAAAKTVLARVVADFTHGRCSAVWNNAAPTLEIERASRIGLRERFAAQNTGYVFYENDD